MSVEKPQRGTAGEAFYAKRNALHAQIISELSAIFPVLLQLMMAHKLGF